MKNITELRNSLADNYEKVRTRKMDLATSKELVNAAGKIISTLKVELEYNKLTKQKKKIKFLD